MGQLAMLGSVLVSTLAAWRGTSLVKAAVQPTQLLQLYDMEGSPYCRAVREALTALGLDAEIYPCPRGGTRFRPQAERLAGKQQFPLLVDPNTGTTMLESAAIVNYLFRTYGGRKTPRFYQPSFLRPVVGGLSGVLRGLRGIQCRASHAPAKLLELWSFESSPYTRLVRERLTELELPYIVRNIGKEQFADMGPAVMRVKPGPYQPVAGGRRAQVLAQLGRVQVPYLEDANTGVKMFESTKIMAYLEQQYAAPAGTAASR
jgi:glutathione S-transferase